MVLFLVKARHGKLREESYLKFSTLTCWKKTFQKFHQYVIDDWLDQFDKDYEEKDGRVKFDPLNLSIRIVNGVMMKCFFGC